MLTFTPKTSSTVILDAMANVMNDRVLIGVCFGVLFVTALCIAVRAGYEAARFDEAMRRLEDARSEPEVLIATLKTWLEAELAPSKDG